MTGAVVVMGVTGVGKSTLGRALASALGWTFVEGDTLHPPANVQKMSSGIPLDDEDRRPFLENVAHAIETGRNTGVVVSCSALKRGYRDLIRERAGQVAFVLPVLDRDRINERIAQRRGHFMPASLLESQLAALEMPEPDERAILVDGAAGTEAQVAQALAGLRAAGLDG